MKNFFKHGKVLTLTAPTGGVVSGGIYKIGDMIVLATASAAQATPFEAVTEGVFEVLKDETAAWAEGQALYFDESSGKVTTDPDDGDNHACGFAAVAAAEAATKGMLYLQQCCLCFCPEEDPE